MVELELVHVEEGDKDLHNGKDNPRMLNSVKTTRSFGPDAGFNFPPANRHLAIATGGK